MKCLSKRKENRMADAKHGKRAPGQKPRCPHGYSYCSSVSIKNQEKI